MLFPTTPRKEFLLLGQSQISKRLCQRMPSPYNFQGPEELQGRI